MRPAILACLLLSSRLALAAGPSLQHGVGGGLSLVNHASLPAGVVAAPTFLSVTDGNGFVDGVSFQLAGVGGFSVMSPYAGTLLAPLPFAEDVVASLLPGLLGYVLPDSTPFYCYIVNTSQQGWDPRFDPANFLFICSLIGPSSDGHPAQVLKPPPAMIGTTAIGGPTFIPTTNALFIGSVITDTGTPPNLMPFYRNGQEVSLVYPAKPQLMDSNNKFLDPVDPGEYPPGFTPTLTFQSAAAPPAVQSFAPRPFPNLSASAAVFDVQVANYDSVPHLVCLIDPNQVAAFNPAAGTQACQGETWVDAAYPVSGMPTVTTYRAVLNVGPQAPPPRLISLGIEANTANALIVLPAYRGYLEPIKHLFAY